MGPTLFSAHTLTISTCFVTFNTCVCLQGCVAPPPPPTPNHHHPNLCRLPVYRAYMASRLWPPASPVDSTDWSFPRNISGREAGNQGGGCGVQRKEGHFTGVPFWLCCWNNFFPSVAPSWCLKCAENFRKVLQKCQVQRLGMNKTTFFPLFSLPISYFQKRMPVKNNLKRWNIAALKQIKKLALEMGTSNTFPVRPQ